MMAIYAILDADQANRHHIDIQRLKPFRYSSYRNKQNAAG